MALEHISHGAFRHRNPKLFAHHRCDSLGAVARVRHFDVDDDLLDRRGDARTPGQIQFAGGRNQPPITAHITIEPTDQSFRPKQSVAGQRG